MLHQRKSGCGREAVAAGARVALHLKSLRCLVLNFLVFSDRLQPDDRRGYHVVIIPCSVVVLADNLSTMSERFTSPIRTAHIVASKTVHNSGVHQRRSHIDNKPRTRATIDSAERQKHERRRSSVSLHLPDEYMHISKAVDSKPAAASNQPKPVMADITTNTYSVSAGEESPGTTRERTEKDPHEVRYSSETVPPCGGGRVRLERECVTVPVEDRYDYIVVGCGAVGCPLARTLADGGNRVLVLERGRRRSFKNTPNAMDIFGAGKAVDDTSVAQPIHTNQGVRTHTAGVMGGGTSINMGIVTMETRPYFENLSKEFGWKFDFNRLEKAFKWVSKAFHVMPQAAAYSSRLRSSLQRYGHRPLHDRRPSPKDRENPSVVNHSQFLHEGYVWGGATLFDPTRRYFRDAADIFLDNSTTQQRNTEAGELVVREGRYVEKVLFEPEGRPTRGAICVLHRQTSTGDMAPLGIRRNRSWQTPREDPAKSRAAEVLQSCNVYFHPPGAFENMFPRIGRIFTSVFGNRSRNQLACIKEGGEIFLSAGAVHTPLLLFRSGIGPREQLAELDVEPTYENAHVGRHLTDRILVPILLFANETAPRNDREPRVCQVLGMRRVGPSCRGVRVNQRTLKCSLIATEELSGPSIVHGLLWASHMLFPPSWRDHPALDAALEFARVCETRLPWRGTPQYPAACVVLQEYIDCLDRSFSVFYFTTEPKSRGYIRQHNGGVVELEANYLKDEQDLFDAVRGAQALIQTGSHFPPLESSCQSIVRKHSPHLRVSTRILTLCKQMVNGGHFDDIAQPLHANSCPVTILRTLVDLVLRFARAGDLDQYKDQLLLVRLHAADLQPPRPDNLSLGLPKTLFAATEFPPHRSTEALSPPLNKEADADAPESMLLGSVQVEGESSLNTHSYEVALREVFRNKEILEKLLQPGGTPSHNSDLSTANAVSSTAEETKMSPWALAAYDSDTCVDPRACKDDFHTETYTTTCLARDVFSKRFKLPACTAQKRGERASTSESLLNTEEWILSLVKRGLTRFFAADLPSGSSQTLATYPPILPRADDPEEVAAFALTYMTSIWHIGGTAAMNFVVDEMFRVKGVHGLSIADASLLNQMTRLNPTATLMTLGRYIGLLRLEAAAAREAPSWG